MEKRFEEWTHEIFEYYNQREKTLVFPHNRKHYLDYLKYNGVFKNWCYPTESYTQTENIGKVSIETIREIGSSPLTNYSFNDEGDTIKYETKLEHLKPFMLNGLRWSRMFELVKVFKFTPLELSIFVGWGEKTPTRALKKFASIYEQEQHKSRIYESYLPKLMIEG